MDPCAKGRVDKRLEALHLVRRGQMHEKNEALEGGFCMAQTQGEKKAHNA